MKKFRYLTLGSLIALGGAGFLGLSIDGAKAQSSCIEQCRNSGWAAGQCNRYCETRYGEPSFRRTGTQVYGYTGTARRGCGQYSYAKAGSCVDARIDPPKLN